MPLWALSSVIDEIVKTNEAALPEDMARRVRLLRLERQDLLHFYYETLPTPRSERGRLHGRRCVTTATPALPD